MVDKSRRQQASARQRCRAISNAHKALGSVGLTARAIAGIVLIALVCCSMVGVLSRTEDAPSAEVRVVDAFISARGALDLNAMPGFSTRMPRS
jgi:hypothetical protein